MDRPALERRAERNVRHEHACASTGVDVTRNLFLDGVNAQQAASLYPPWMQLRLLHLPRCANKRLFCERNSHMSVECSLLIGLLAVLPLGLPASLSLPPASLALLIAGLGLLAVPGQLRRPRPRTSIDQRGS